MGNILNHINLNIANLLKANPWSFFGDGGGGGSPPLSYNPTDISEKVFALSDAAVWGTYSGLATPNHAHLFNLATLLQNTLVGTGDFTSDGLPALQQPGGLFSEGAQTIVGAQPNNLNDSLDGDVGLMNFGNESFAVMVLLTMPSLFETNKGLMGNRDSGGLNEGWEFTSTGEGGVIFAVDDGATARSSTASYRHRWTNEPVILLGVANQAQGFTQLFTSLGDGNRVASCHSTSVASTAVTTVGAGRRQHSVNGCTFIGSAAWTGAAAEAIVDRSPVDAFMKAIGIGPFHDRNDLVP